MIMQVTRRIPKRHGYWESLREKSVKILLKSVRNYRIGDVDVNFNVDLDLNIEMKYLKAIWMLCSYLFWPQRRPKEDAANRND